MRYEILKADALTPANRIYPIDVVQGIFWEIQDRDMFVVMGPATSFSIKTEKIIGTMIEPILNDGVLTVGIHPMNTSLGKVYSSLLEDKVDMKLSLCGISSFRRPSIVVEDYILLYGSVDQRFG